MKDDLVAWCKTNATMERERAPTFAAMFDKTADRMATDAARIEALKEALRRVAARTRDYDTLSIIELALDPEQKALRRARNALASTREGLTGGEESRPCTCHPDERPEPCPRKYALSDCLAKNTDSPPPMGEMG